MDHRHISWRLFSAGSPKTAAVAPRGRFYPGFWMRSGFGFDPLSRLSVILDASKWSYELQNGT